MMRHRRWLIVLTLLIKAIDPRGMGGGIVQGDPATDDELEYLRSDAQEPCLTPAIRRTGALPCTSALTQGDRSSWPLVTLGAAFLRDAARPASVSRPPRGLLAHPAPRLVRIWGVRSAAAGRRSAAAGRRSAVAGRRASP